MKTPRALIFDGSRNKNLMRLNKTSLPLSCLMVKMISWSFVFSPLFCWFWFLINRHCFTTEDAFEVSLKSLRYIPYQFVKTTWRPEVPFVYITAVHTANAFVIEATSLFHGIFNILAFSFSSACFCTMFNCELLIYVYALRVRWKRIKPLNDMFTHGFN